jgi:NADH-quinone oxidoreductase subunit E
MLTAEECREVEIEAARYAQKRAAAPEALKIAQRSRGWVSDETLHDVAALLDMTAAELDGIATFYNLIFRKPVGRHVILVCDSVSCWVMGYEKVVEHVEKRLGVKLGGTTADGRFTLLPIACLGACDHAPAMMIDDELYCDLAPEKIDEILSRYRGKEGL